MNNKNHDKIIFNTADIQRYLNGQMPVEEMHALELAAMEDAFLADAIEGYENKTARGEFDVLEDFNDLQGRIEKRIESPRRRILPLFNTQLSRIAAFIILLAGSGMLMYYLANNLDTDKIEVAKNSSLPEKISSKDSSQVSIANNSDTAIIAGNNKELKRPDLFSHKENAPLQKPLGRSLPSRSISPATAKAPVEKAEDSLLAGNEPANDLKAAYEDYKFLSKKSAKETNPSVIGSGTIAPAQVFQGRVVNQNKQPVPNVAMMTLSRTNGLKVTTDSGGYFRFTAPDTMASVVINKEGFETARVHLQGNAGDKEIMLKQIDESLNEVVVTGYSARKKKEVLRGNRSLDVPKAEPVNGMNAYRLYLETHKNIPVQLNNLHGEVTIKFNVSKEGRLSNFKIEKSLSRLLNEEAIRLIKEGPAWKVLDNKKTKATITVNF